MTLKNEARFLTLIAIGFGVVMWIGLRQPKVANHIIIWYYSIGTVLMPLAMLLRFRGSANAAKGMVFCAMFVFLYHTHLTISENNLAKITSFLAFLSAALAFATLLWNIQNNAFWPRARNCVLGVGYAGQLGALLVGLTQFGIVSAGFLAMAQILNWELDGAREDRRLSIAIIATAVIIPATMMMTFRIGHGLAIPLIGSTCLGSYLWFYMILSSQDQ